MIFISHANEPTDNEFTRWLALRLAGLGYPVWCDMTKLLGGEKSWDDIEEAIRQKTEKVVVVLSRNSNDRESVLKEVTLAARVGKTKGDFLIPVRIDDLPNDEVTIELARLNSIDFKAGWASGFAQLIAKLEKDGVAKNAAVFNANAVATWWKEHQRQVGEVNSTEEVCASNWFAISDLPEQIFVHSLAKVQHSHDPIITDLRIPHFCEKRRIFTFEGPEHLTERLRRIGMEVLESRPCSHAAFWRHGDRSQRLSKNDARNIITSLLQQGITQRLESAGLKQYLLSGEKACYWFPPGFTEGDKVWFDSPDFDVSGRKRNRMLVGRQFKQNRELARRRWHFAIQPKLIRWPTLSFAIQSHVVFTDATGDLLSKEKQHSARRSACRSWHNDKWLNMMLAAMAYLKYEVGSSVIRVPCGQDVHFNVSTLPITFRSPISYGTSAEVVQSAIHDDQNNDLEDEYSDDDENDDDDDFSLEDPQGSK